MKIQKIVKAGIIFDTETHEGVLFIDSESNPNNEAIPKECPECGGKLVRGNTKGAFDCMNPDCDLISVFVDKNGNYKRFIHDSLMKKKV